MKIDIKLSALQAGLASSKKSNGWHSIEARNLNVFYGDFLAVKDVNLNVEPRKITAIIGPSGCGKSTVIRAFNRMNELIPSVKTEGEVVFGGRNIYERH